MSLPGKRENDSKYYGMPFTYFRERRISDSNSFYSLSLLSLSDLNGAVRTYISVSGDYQQTKMNASHKSYSQKSQHCHVFCGWLCPLVLAAVWFWTCSAWLCKSRVLLLV